MSNMPGKLTLIATPIGNLGDLSPRAREVLAGADIWFVEDSRVSGKLQQIVETKVKMLVVNEHTSEPKLAQYVEEIAANDWNAALISDAGTPGISDPGARLADLCYEAGIEIDAVPGPSAPVMLLSMSGFYAQRYAFLGYLPRKPGPMARELEPFIDSPYTLVLFESPFRIDDLLEVATKTLGNRRYVIGRELTKVHQQIVRMRLPERPSPSEMPRKGEFTVVIEGHRRHREDADSG
jgi:16S rRNA (cytidine1402-2'-O)-methyltransferase